MFSSKENNCFLENNVWNYKQPRWMRRTDYNRNVWVHAVQIMRHLPLCVLQHVECQWRNRTVVFRNSYCRNMCAVKNQHTLNSSLPVSSLRQSWFKFLSPSNNLLSFSSCHYFHHRISGCHFSPPFLLHPSRTLRKMASGSSCCYHTIRTW